MDKIIPHLLIFFLFNINLLAQVELEKKKHEVYFTWIYTIDETISGKGLLVGSTDVNMSFVKQNQFDSWKEDPVKFTQNYPIENIELIKFRKKGKVQKGVLYGGLGGTLLVTFIAATSSCSGQGFCFKPSATESLVAGVIVGGLPGILLGGIATSGKIIIPLNGSYNKYKQLENEIRKYQYFFK